MSTNLVLDIAILALLWAGVGAAWNLLAGYAGQFSLGHGAFFGIGAYGSTLAFLHWGVSPWLGSLIGIAAAILLAVVIGVVGMRTRGPFFTLITIAFAEVVRILTIYFSELTKGSEGLILPFKADPANMIFEGKLPFLAITAVYAAGTLAFCHWLRQSRLGYALLANREDEDAARALGVFTFRSRIAALSMSATITAFGGTVFAQYTLFIDPDSTMSFLLSVKPALITIIGGLGAAAGPLLGACLVVPLEYLLRAWFGGGLAGLHGVIFGVILILVLFAMPSGLIQPLRLLFGRRGSSQHA